MIAKEITDEIERYRAFDECWDGYSAPKFSNTVCDRAIELSESIVFMLNALETNALVFPGPCPDGTIDLEIQMKDISIFYLISDDGPIRMEIIKHD